jgi:hypothetical protein
MKLILWMNSKCKMNYKSTSSHNKICCGMNAINNYLFNKIIF